MMAGGVAVGLRSPSDLQVAFLAASLHCGGRLTWHVSRPGSRRRMTIETAVDLIRVRHRDRIVFDGRGRMYYAGTVKDPAGVRYGERE